jgi:hypothetical protein
MFQGDVHLESTHNPSFPSQAKHIPVKTEDRRRQKGR